MHGPRRGERHDLHLVGDCSLQMVLRVLNLLAQFDAEPDHISLERSRSAYVLRIRDCGVGAQRRELLAEKLRALLLVSEVRVDIAAPRASWRRP